MSNKKINEMLPSEQRLGQIGLNNQNEVIKIIAYRGAKDIDVQFEDGVIITNKSYDNFLRGKMKHPIRYEDSIAYYIQIELGEDINKYWSRKNTVSPYDVYKQSHKKVWIYCQEKDYHNNEDGYEVVCSTFYNGCRCPFCNSFASHKVHRLDSLGYLYPQIAQMIVDDERNNVTMEDMYKISPYSDKNFYFKCNKCKKGSSKKKQLNTIVRREFSCEYCSDGISIPNKMLRQISEQLGLNWKFEHIEEWLGQKRLDGYDDNFKIAIEMDAEYKDNHKDKRKEVDNWKDEQCLKHGIYTIRIDLMDKNEYDNNKFEYIKRQILNSPLTLIYDFSNFDWDLAKENSLKSLLWDVKELIEEGYNSREITEILKICKKTVVRYKKELGIESKNETCQKNLLKAKELFKEGKTNEEIAKILNVNKATVISYKKELGIEVKGNTKQKNLLKTKELVQQGKSTKEIAEILNVSRVTINSYKRELREKNLI